MNDGAYQYLEHGADIGVEGHGHTVEAAFVAAAEATFALMVDREDVRLSQTVRFSFVEPDQELALVTWLNRLLAEARAAGLALARFALRRAGDTWMGEAEGEPWRPDLERGVEVKGATLTMLAVQPAAGGWTARCVVDV